MEPILELRGIQRSFGEQKVLKDISFKVYPGELIGYIGPNGAGKSTTVKIILGLLEKDAGEMFFHGQPLDTSNPSYRRRIGYVPEQSTLYDTLTLEEYLYFAGRLFGLEEATIYQRSTPMLESLGMTEHLHKRLGAFSKGMRQKTMIICSLLHDPEILFWDEPLSGLDANTVLVIKEIMLKLTAMGKSLFYSSHNMDTVERISRRIMLLDDGRIAADGAFEDLVATHGQSLESLFNELTGFHEHEALADQFISSLR